MTRHFRAMALPVALFGAWTLIAAVLLSVAIALTHYVADVMTTRETRETLAVPELEPCGSRASQSAPWPGRGAVIASGATAGTRPRP